MAQDSKITTKAIQNIISSPSKLSKFKLLALRESTTQDHITLMAKRAFTLAKLDTEHKQRFAKFIALTDSTTADFGYLCILLSNEARSYNCDFKINPILELYEDLLRENWSIVKAERDTLDSIDAFEKTPASNVKICEAIVRFLREYVLCNSKNYNV